MIPFVNITLLTQRGVSVKAALLLCAWKQICEKCLRHTWPARSHRDLIIKLVMEAEHDVNWLEKKNPRFPLTGLLTHYVAPKLRQCAENEKLCPRGAEEALTGPASKGSLRLLRPRLPPVLTFQRWMPGRHLSTQTRADTGEVGTSKSAGQEHPIQGMSDTALSFHTVLVSRIRKNEIRLMDLDLISSALSTSTFQLIH